MNETLINYEANVLGLPGLEGFDIRRGIDIGSPLAETLIEKSKEPEIVRATPDDCMRRFADIESLDRWLLSPGQERYLYPLVDIEQDDLAGVVWHGPKPFPIKGLYASENEPSDTFAIRLYEGYEGRNLALPFMGYCLADYVTIVAQNGRAGAGKFHGVWLSTEPDKKPKEYSLFKRFGYVDVTPRSRKAYMVLTPEKIFKILTDKAS